MAISPMQQAWIDVYNNYSSQFRNAKTEEEKRFWEANLKQIQPTLDALDIRDPSGGGHSPLSLEIDGDNPEFVVTTTPETEFNNNRPPPSTGSNFPDREGPAGGKWDDLIEKYAEKYGVDPNVIKAIMAKESQGDPSLISWAGAVGLMQVKPGTASEMLGREVTADELIRNPELNIEAGIKYFAKMLADKGGNLEDALGAYNQGPGANWRSIPESVDYVEKIMAALRNGTLPTWG